MNMNNPTQPPVLHQPKPTTPTAAAFNDIWKDVGEEVYSSLSVVDGYSADAAFDTLFERLWDSMLGMALKEQGEQGCIRTRRGWVWFHP